MWELHVDCGEMGDFPVNLGSHQELTLSPSLFAMIADDLNAHIQAEVPWCIFLHMIWCWLMN